LLPKPSQDTDVGTGVFKYTWLVSPMRVLGVSLEEEMPGEIADDEEQHEYDKANE
jgi:hypothetical protein